MTARMSSPAATGGAGTTLEQQVGAYWLAQLLVGAIQPLFIDTTLSEVSFQTEHLGWQTDDFLVVCARTGGPSQRLAGQVERSFTVSAADEECGKAIGDFWKDFTVRSSHRRTTGSCSSRSAHFDATLQRTAENSPRISVRRCETCDVSSSSRPGSSSSLVTRSSRLSTLDSSVCGGIGVRSPSVRPRGDRGTAHGRSSEAHADGRR